MMPSELIRHFQPFVNTFSHSLFKMAQKTLKSLDGLHVLFPVVGNIGFNSTIIKIGPVGKILCYNRWFICRKLMPSWKMAAILKFQWIMFFINK